MGLLASAAPRPSGVAGHGVEGPSDVFVAFGVTGDIARRMTLPALYQLERRGLLECPVVAVAPAGWTDAQLDEHARRCIEAHAHDVAPAIYERFASRMRYVSGDFGDPRTFERVAAAMAGATRPLFHLEIPPGLIGPVMKGLAGAELTEHARVVVEKPFGHDLTSARSLNEDLHAHIDERRLYRVDHLLGRLGLEEILHLRFANAMLEPVWNRHCLASVQITLAETSGVGGRGDAYDGVGALRDVVVDHLMQVVAAVAMEPPTGADEATLKDAAFAVLRSMDDADPAHCARGQYEGYRDLSGVAAGSSTETYVALRLEIDNWRWSGVPFFIRAGKHLPVTQTEVRLVFRRPPPLRFGRSARRRPEPDQLVVKLDPTTGVRLQLDARGPAAREPEAIALDVGFDDEGPETPSPYASLLADAMEGDGTRFARQDAVLEAWRVIQPLLDAPPPIHAYPKGSWGPQAAAAVVAGEGRWHAPWVTA